MSDQGPETLPGLTTLTCSAPPASYSPSRRHRRRRQPAILERSFDPPRAPGHASTREDGSSPHRPATTCSDTEFDRAAWIEVQDGLAQHGVRRVRVSYDGRVDGGKINEPAYTPCDLHVPRDLSAELRRLIEGLLPGLWNVGEGSQGEFVIDLERRTITQRHFEHYLAARASRTQHFRGF